MGAVGGGGGHTRWIKPKCHIAGRCGQRWEWMAESRSEELFLSFQYAGLHLPSEGNVQNKILGEFFRKLKKTI